MKIIILSDFLPDRNIILSPATSSLFRTADKIVFNLEGSPLLSDEVGNLENQIMPFDPDFVIDFIKSYGVDKFCVALANNHILDNGVKGFDFFVKRLDESQIQYFGTKDHPSISVDNVQLLNFVSAETVANKKLGESRLNYLFYNTNELNAQIKGLEEKSDKLILYPHWGRDMDRRVFKTYDKKIMMSKKWLVFGHHPHVISGIEKDKIYSMGNNYIPHPYYFDRYPASRYGLVVVLETQDMSYKIYSTVLTREDKNYVIDTMEFEGLSKEVLLHGQNFSSAKKLFLDLFSFSGNTSDFLKLKALQGVAKLLLFRYKLLKKNHFNE